MSAPAPAWIAVDPSALRAGCGLEAHQILEGGEDDDDKFETHIADLINDVAPTVASKCRTAAGNIPFPFKPAMLAIAFPDETSDESAQRGIEMTNTARQVVEAMVVAKMSYSITGDVYQTKADGKWRSASTMLTGLVKSIESAVTEYRRLALVTAFFPLQE